MTKPGILAIWQNPAKGHEEELEHWYQSEHVIERVGVPGFRRGRRYEALDAPWGLFTYYETDAPEVLASDAYLARLNAPTELTHWVMTNALARMSRTLCRIEHRAGDFRGAVAVAVKLHGECDATEVADTLSRDHGVARVEFWTAATELAPPASDEEKLRGGDERIDACLLVETLRDADARRAAEHVKTQLGGYVAEIGLYRLLCDLEAQPMAG